MCTNQVVKSSAAAKNRMAKDFRDRLAKSEAIEKEYYIQVRVPDANEHTNHTLNQVKNHITSNQCKETK